MSSSSATHPSTPSTVWLTRGLHTGSAPGEVVRGYLQRLKETEEIVDFLELGEDVRPSGRLVFEARWTVGEDVTVRARLEIAEEAERGTTRPWALVAEAEEPWNRRWPSPATRFWSEEPWEIDGQWDHSQVAGLRFREATALPSDDKDLRRVLKSAMRDDWSIHVVVHEAMTPDARGRLPLTRFLTDGLRDRVVEHRAAPQQLRAVNWALKESRAELPRGGAVILPHGDVDPADFAVRTVFLDGSEPSELVDAITRFTTVPQQLPDDADALLTALREDWHLLTLREELDRERQLVAMYADALDAMTKSRDLYREAAERAHEALEVFRESAGVVDSVSEPTPTRPAQSPFQQITRTFERFKLPKKTED
ncbi:hypothetical protein DF268_42205 [Streptomyces sp. V2]|uniref:Uncharacterized protein n=1 Tax=Streptomyces niveiscabiei TaxID=164115 RepID=A0ABW9HLV1_9ACTN|nr:MULTISPECIES: hypothetical protein [unclassified Streptomyces]PWG07614.1 hypothetical protein DF268_42205 [Streptomyces sp. V2]QZZ25891.1 hypothetical protein A7X85_06225 [Streptomyces sp. ST1015]